MKLIVVSKVRWKPETCNEYTNILQNIYYYLFVFSVLLSNPSPSWVASWSTLTCLMSNETMTKHKAKPSERHMTELEFEWTHHVLKRKRREGLFFSPSFYVFMTQQQFSILEWRRYAWRNMRHLENFLSVKNFNSSLNDWWRNSRNKSQHNVENKTRMLRSNWGWQETNVDVSVWSKTYGDRQKIIWDRFRLLEICQSH